MSLSTTTTTTMTASNIRRNISLGVYTTHKTLKMKAIAQRHHHSKRCTCFFFLFLYLLSFFLSFGIVYVISFFVGIWLHIDSLHSLQIRYNSSEYDMQCAYSLFYPVQKYHFVRNASVCGRASANSFMHKTNINRPHKKLLHNTFRGKSNSP